MKPNPNILMLQEVAYGLGTLVDEIVFVGGAVTGLYVNDPAAPQVTPSDDVDCVVELVGAVAYSKLEAKLRRLGFKTPVEDEDRRVLCRWDYKGILVDVMPTDKKILGFSNRWYPDAIKNKISITLPNKMKISIFNPAFFIAAKMEALKARGGKDLRFSHDLEDIVAVLDGHVGIELVLEDAPANVQKYLKTEFRKLLKNGSTREAVLGFLQGVTISAVRANRVLEIMGR